MGQVWAPGTLRQQRSPQSTVHYCHCCYTSTSADEVSRSCTPGSTVVIYLSTSLPPLQAACSATLSLFSHFLTIVAHFHFTSRPDSLLLPSYQASVNACRTSSLNLNSFLNLPFRFIHRAHRWIRYLCPGGRVGHRGAITFVRCSKRPGGLFFPAPSLQLDLCDHCGIEASILSSPISNTARAVPFATCQTSSSRSRRRSRLIATTTHCQPSPFRPRPKPFLLLKIGRRPHDTGIPFLVPHPQAAGSLSIKPSKPPYANNHFRLLGPAI